MERYAVVTPQNIGGYLAEMSVLICIIRKSRLKCKQLAVLELMSLLSDFAPLFIANGPLGDVRGVIPLFITLDKSDKAPLRSRLDSAGYSGAFYLLDFEDPASDEDTPIKSINPMVWKRRPFAIRELYRQNDEEFRAQAADRRTFRLLCGDGVVRDIHGYRGDGGEIGRRALPVEDCRLLANLACGLSAQCILDPFAGGGGIVYQAKRNYSDVTVASCDIAPELAPGLEAYGAVHCIGDAAVYAPGALHFDAIVSEVPFADSSTEVVCRAVSHLAGFMRERGRFILMCTPEQTGRIRECLCRAGYSTEVFAVDRKGTEIEILLSFKDARDDEAFRLLWKRLCMFR